MSENIITCAECGCVIESDGIEICGEFYCSEECANNAGYYKCDKCGAWEHEDDLIEFEGELYCESCRGRANLCQCEECGEWYRDYNLTEVEMGWRRSNIYVCEDCLESMVEHDDVFYCDDCECYYSTHYVDRFYVSDSYVICEGCYSDNYHTCDGCGEIIHDSDAYWSDEDDCYYCESCYNRYRRARNIHDYGFRPSPVFHGIAHSRPTFGDPLTIGFELEVDDGNDRKGCSEAIVNAFDEDTLYLKSDSSVDFEIVTHPHTLKAYMTELDTAKLCSIPGKFGYSSHNAGTCGLHCHVGRAQLGASEDDEREVIGRIAILMYRHWNSLVRFSRRTNSQLSQWACAPDLPIEPSKAYMPSELYRLVENYYSRRGRYQALNLCNRNTIEFRLWRGTLCEETLLATLQLTSNIVRYCMENDLKTVAESKWYDVCSFENFDELDSYLAKRDLIGDGDVKNISVTEEVEIRGGSNAPTGKFAIGDTVQICSSSDLVNAAAIGARGTVIAREYLPEYATSEPCCLIRLENPDNDPAIASFMRVRCHNGDWRSNESDCYWAEAECLALIDRPIAAGARLYCRGLDRVGTVVVPDTGCGLVGMDFGPGFDGHYLDGSLDTLTGWWVRDNELSAVELNVVGF